MKTKYFLYGLLPMAAGLLLTACSNDQIDLLDEVPETKTVLTRTIPYKVTVQKDELTRAKLADDKKTLQFAEGDRIFLYGGNAGGDYNLYGYLSVDNEGIGSSTSVTFSGDLTLEEGYSNAFDQLLETEDVPLFATLISQDCDILYFNDETKRYGKDPGRGGDASVSYTNKFYNTLAEAVSAGSYMKSTNSVKYSSSGISNNITLTQHSGFMCFTITFAGGVAANKDVKLSVAGLPSSDSSNSYRGRTGTVKTYEEGGVVKAYFVIPIYGGSTTSGKKASTSMPCSVTMLSLKSGVYDSQYSSIKANFNTNKQKFYPVVYNIALTLPAITDESLMIQ